MSNENTDLDVGKKSIFLVSNKIYDVLKFVVTLLIPGISTLYFTLGAIWDFPNVEQVIGTLAAIATFLGIFLKKSSNVYKNDESRFDGDIVITKSEDGKKVYTLALNGQPNLLDDKSTVSFKVKAAA